MTQGIEDSPENLVSDMLVGGDNKGDPELVAIVANGALDSANWLTYEGGVSWKHDLMQFGGHNIKRSIIPITHSGSEMTTKLTNRVNGMDDIVLIDNTKAVELVTDDAGAVTGVKVENPVTGDTSEVKCKAVVLATGGFGSNVDMRVKYNPEMDDKILSTDSVAAQGDGIVMAEKIGADTIDMEYIQTYPVCDPETGALLYVGDVRLENHGILGEQGRRPLRARARSPRRHFQRHQEPDRRRGLPPVRSGGRPMRRGCSSSMPTSTRTARLAALS